MKSRKTTLAAWFISTAMLATILLLAMPGCAGVAAGTGAGAGTVVYVRGALEATVGTEYPKVLDSTRWALKDLQFIKATEEKDALNARLVAFTGVDKKVEITLTNSGEKLTNIRIKVGLFGDQQVSQAILDKIKARL